ncbi:MAG: superoxide dismutase, Ni [Actinomycetota bacterium]
MTVTARLLNLLERHRPAGVLSAHCDGPCGVYDPASARIAAESVKAMTQKLIDLDMSAAGAHNTFTRFVNIKEEQAELVKIELNILQNDYFKPVHLEEYPDLLTTFWNAVKAASATKQSIDIDACNDLLSQVEAIHNIFWATKGREVAWVLANP